MREIVFIQMGQCGNKVGEKFWETISDEHMINRSGQFYGDNILPYQRLDVYFDCGQNNRFVPRCVLCDLEPSQIYSLRCSAVGSLFNPDHIVTGSRGAGNNWAKGFYTEGAELMDGTLEITRKQVEECECLQGFQMVHSIGGGTGSGMGSLLINQLRDEYQDRIINTFSVIPSDKVSETVVEPYNAVLALQELIFNTDETITFDNEALYSVCLKTLKLDHPTLVDLNHLISLTMSGVTSCFRYPGQLNMDLRKLMTNLCPYPRLKFFLPGYAPLQSKHNSLGYEKITVKGLVDQLFDQQSQLTGYDASCGKYLTCAAIFRGLMSTKEIEEAMVKVQETNKDKFCKWIPNNIKTAICDIPPHGISSSVTLLANTTAITPIFSRLIRQFDSMFEKRAFVHWYTGEGMEEQEFRDAKNCLVDICEEYAEACNNNDEGDEISDHPAKESDLESDDNCSVYSQCDGDRSMCSCNCDIEIEIRETRKS